MTATTPVPEQSGPQVDASTIRPAPFKRPRRSQEELHDSLRSHFFPREGAAGGKSDVPRGADGKFVSPAAAAPQPPEPEDSSTSPAAEPEGENATEPRHDAQQPEEKDTQPSKAQSREHHLARENKALKEKLARIEAERKALVEEQKKAKREQAVEAVLSTERPKGYEEWDEERRTAWLADQTARAHLDPEHLEEMRRVALEYKVSRALRNDDLNDDQLGAVMSVLELHPTLTPRAALAVAATESPDLFIDEEPEPEEEAPKPPPPTHRVTEPSQSSRGRAPTNNEAKERKALMEAVRSRDPRVRDQAAHELLKKYNRDAQLWDRLGKR